MQSLSAVNTFSASAWLEFQILWLKIGATTGGVNPKINNMLQGYKVAKYDLIWINDSGLFGKSAHMELLLFGSNKGCPTVLSKSTHECMTTSEHE